MLVYMDIAGRALLIIGIAYGATSIGVRLYWTWQDRREEKRVLEAESESKMLTDPDAVDEEWRKLRGTTLPHGKIRSERQRSSVLAVAGFFAGTGLILLLLGRLL